GWVGVAGGADLAARRVHRRRAAIHPRRRHQGRPWRDAAAVRAAAGGEDDAVVKNALIAFAVILSVAKDLGAREARRPPPQVPRSARDDIGAMVRGVEAKNLEHTVRTLVSFGTRSTLSAQDNPKRGIGAARDWIKSEFDKIAATSGGRMTVELQTFTQEPG